MPAPIRSRPPRPAQAGFLLPLVSVGAVVLLLTGLSLQTAVLHQRQLVAEALRQRQGEDALASAAQRLVQQLDGPYRHLLPLPLTQWPAAERAVLQEGQEAGQPVRLLAWEPPLLQLALVRSDGRGLGQQRRFAVELDPAGRVRALRELGS